MIPEVFVSGMSSINDFKGVVAAQAPVGVQVQEISPEVAKLIVRYANRGGQVFIDSGAFTAFQKGTEVDFASILHTYKYLADRTRKPENLKVVAPDVVGDMDATAALQDQYGRELLGLKRTGVEILIPFQRGWPTYQYLSYFGKMQSILNSFTVALPCNARAWELDSISELLALLKLPKVHLLGVGKKGLVDHVDAIRKASPFTVITADANRVRAMIGEGRKITESTRAWLSMARDMAHRELLDAYDETEAVYDLYNTPGYLGPHEARLLAALLGVESTSELRKWSRGCNEPASEIHKKSMTSLLETENSYGCKLGYLIEQADPYHKAPIMLAFIQDGLALRDIQADAITKNLSPLARRQAIEMAVRADQEQIKENFLLHEQKELALEPEIEAEEDSWQYPLAFAPQ